MLLERKYIADPQAVLPAEKIGINPQINPDDRQWSASHDLSGLVLPQGTTLFDNSKFTDDPKQPRVIAELPNYEHISFRTKSEALKNLPVDRRARRGLNVLAPDAVPQYFDIHIIGNDIGTRVMNLSKERAQELIEIAQSPTPENIKKLRMKGLNVRTMKFLIAMAAVRVGKLPLPPNSKAVREDLDGVRSLSTETQILREWTRFQLSIFPKLTIVLEMFLRAR